MNRTGNPEEDKGKIFVGGLSWETTNDGLKNYFSKHGEIIDCKVMINRMTQKSRGFGFVTFKDPSSVDLVLSSPSHELDGKRIDPKGCNQQQANLNHTIKASPKVFVGGVPFSVDKDEMRTFFQQYGMVLDVNLMLGKDRDPTRHRGFGFVTFESQETVDRLLALRFVELQGRQVEIKKAEPQTPRPGGGQGGGQWGGEGQGQQGGGQWGPQQQWGPPAAGGWPGQQEQWGGQQQWGGQGGQGWEQQQWAGYGPGYGYGYDQSWQQPAAGAAAGQWGAQGDASQAQAPAAGAGGAAPAAGYPPQPANNGYAQQGYGQSYGQYGQAPAGGAQPPAAPAAAGYGGYDAAAAPAAGGQTAPAAGGYPPQPAAAPAAGGYGAEAAPQQGYNRQQPGYHPYKR